jgi:hypothetical protein
LLGYTVTSESFGEHIVGLSLRRNDTDYLSTFYNGTTLLTLSSVSMKWRVGVLKLVCHEAALLHAKILSIPLRCLKPDSGWSGCNRTCDGPDCRLQTGIWMLWAEDRHLSLMDTCYPACASLNGSNTVERFMRQHAQYKYVVCSLECGHALHQLLCWTSFGSTWNFARSSIVLATHDYHSPSL